MIHNEREQFQKYIVILYLDILLRDIRLQIGYYNSITR